MRPSSSPRFKALSVENKNNVLVRILTGGSAWYPMRLAIMRHVPFASQYALACAVPRVICGRNPRNVPGDVRERAVRTLLLQGDRDGSVETGGGTLAFAEFLIDPKHTQWNGNLWYDLMDSVGRRHLSAFIDPLVVWAERHDPRYFSSQPEPDMTRMWWRGCTAHRAPRHLLEAFVTRLGHKLMRPARLGQTPLATCISDMVRGGSDWDTIACVRSMLERVPGRPNEPPIFIREFDALNGANITVLQHRDDMLRVDPAYDPWRFLLSSSNWDGVTAEAMAWFIQWHGYPDDKHGDGDTSLLCRILNQALDKSCGNYACYDWIEQHIVGRPDGEETGRREHLAPWMLKNVGMRYYAPLDFHLSKLWQYYGTQFLTIHEDVAQNTLTYCRDPDNRNYYNCLARALRVYWPRLQAPRH